MESSADPDEVVELLITEHGFNELSRLDRRFIKELLFGSLRWYSKIYWILQNTSTRDLATLSPQVRAALLLGTYQIFYMDKVPDRAAVHESVEYIRKKGEASAVGFVNGILRTIARRSEYFAKPDKERKPAEYLSLQYAHPRWLVDRWLNRFHFEKMKELLSSNNQPPPYFIRINTLQVPGESIQSLRELLLKDENNHSEKKAIRSCLQLKQSPLVGVGSLFQKGQFTIQDEASQLIAPLLSPKEGEVIYDACSGPGGKTGHIFELSGGLARITAVEKDPGQIKKAQETFARLTHNTRGEQVTWLEQDFLSFQPEEKADKILLDAPCSGLGVIRRHPEGKWRKSPKSIPILSALQEKLLAHAFSLLKPGGELVYSVCSFEPEETLHHLNWLEQQYKGSYELISPSSRLPDYYKRFVTRENALMIYSGNKDGMDGFGAFIIKKI